MPGTSALDEQIERKEREAGRRTDSLRRLAERVWANKLHPPLAQGIATDRIAPVVPTSQAIAAAARQSAQLPAFAPLLEELEVAGWSSHRRNLSGNFHDWLLLERRTLLVMVGQAGTTLPAESIDPIEGALVAQGAWASIRSHAQHAAEAGTLLSLAARSLWSTGNAGLHASVGVALVDLDGGHASVALAGDCLALKIRAADSEHIAAGHPALGAASEFMYPSHSIQLSLRERILLVADEPLRRPAMLATKIANRFSRLDAESHRRMIASDAVALVREFYESQTDENGRAAASIAAVRRH